MKKLKRQVGRGFRICSWWNSFPVTGCHPIVFFSSLKICCPLRWRSGWKVQARWNQICQKNHFNIANVTLVNFKLFPRASKIFKSRKICPHLVQNVTNRKSRLKKECSTREFYYTAWASQNFSIRLIIDLESYGHKSFLKFWNCTFEAIKFTIYQCRNVAKTRKNGNPKSVFSQTTII